jgi:hypothetical protein
MSDNKKIQNELILLGKFLGGIAALVTAIWFFGRAPFNEKVNELMDSYILSEHYKANHKVLTKEFVESADFKIFVDDVIDKYEEHLQKEDSSKIGLRKLLADKMGIDEDEVHIELGRMFKAEKVLFKDLKDEIIRVIKRYHPNIN